jgi:hypothetical protein
MLSPADTLLQVWDATYHPCWPENGTQRTGEIPPLLLVSNSVHYSTIIEKLLRLLEFDYLYRRLVVMYLG